MKRELANLLKWDMWDEAKAPQVHPPYTIHKIKGKYYVQNSLGVNKNAKGYDTEEEARKLQTALYSALPPGYKVPKK